MELEHLKFQSFIRKDTRLKVIILSCFFFFQIFSSLAQGRDNFWILGYKYSNGTNGNSILNFDTLPVVPHKVDMGLNFLESNASLTDTKGHLLFYTNGVKIMNRNAQIMINGDSLNPSSYTSSFKNDGLRIAQGQLIIPFPGDTNKYYLFHETIDFNVTTYQPFHLFYSIIDMSLDSGRGMVIQKNISIINDTLLVGEFSACKHANGRDWWIVVHQNKSNLFYTLLLTPSGVSINNQQSIGTVIRKGGGRASFSPDGKFYAHYNRIMGLDLFSFDRCSGTLGNWQHLDSITGSGGIAFSSNSQELYLTSDTNLYQFNLADTTQSLNNLKFLVAQWDSFFSPAPPFATTFYMPQLASDKKIYISCGSGVPNLHVINYPDSNGVACGVSQHSITLPTVNGFTIPSFPNYHLGADSGSVCDTLMLSINQSPSASKGFLVSVFPNPAKDFISISSIPENSSIEIYSTQGQLVFNTTVSSNDLRVNTQQLRNGIYYLKIQNSNGIKTSKVSILH